LSLGGSARDLMRRVADLDRCVSARLTLPPPKSHPVWQLLHWAATGGAHLGDGILWVVVGLIAYLASGARGKSVVVVTALTLLLAGGAVSAIKLLVHRQRPTVAGDRSSFYYDFDAYAFPSGHACRVFCVATLVGAAYPSWCRYGGLAFSSVSGIIPK